MKLKNPGNLVLAVLMLAVTMVGCTHQLQIKNLSSYYNTSINSLENPVRVGIRSTCSDFEDQQLVRGIGSNLSKYNARVTTNINGDNSNVDVVATISVLSDYKGSGWNFLINFPGFLVWAPAWHGYNYQVNHNVNVHLTDAKTGKSIDTINVPVSLNIRHADFDRTWTELSWLEFGVIAFVGGIVFIAYDDDITPMVAQRADHVITDYIAQRVAGSLTSYKPVMVEKPVGADGESVETKLERLNSLKEKGLISDGEYQSNRKAILSTL
ncbi:MAG: SHOCT domain-containing protein [Verrucomicrobia bacterium]|nr:SHOCT domain-containing protein [Verrucomicrobiota bacterium]